MKFFYTRLISLFLKKSTLTLFAFLLLYFPVFATVYNVTNTTDGNAVNQLRGAILAADGSAGPHTINVAAGTYNLTLGQITFGNSAQNITITGAGPANTIINMTTTGQNRIFFINPPGTIAGIQTTISGIRFTNGRLTSDAFGGGAIICGGLNNSMTISNCEFVGNSTNVASASGGALAFLPGGTLSINQCLFTSNSSTTSGGAIFFNTYSYNNPGYIYPSTIFTLTNSTFSGNTAGSGGSGGALALAIQGFSESNPPFPTLSVNITENTFTNNSAPGANGVGGAISVTNSFSTTNTVNINYNRFTGNTSGSSNGSALFMADNQGNVNATNNWWGCNTGPATCADKAYRFPGSAPGTLTTTPYLQLRSTPSPASVCGGSPTTVASGFTLNSASNAIAASDLSAFTGLTITFNNATLGTVSPATATIQAATGTATTTYTAGSTAGTGFVYAQTDNVPASDLTSRASITIISAPTITDQPDNAVTCAGTSVSFTAAASGSGTISYQWFKGAVQLNNGATGTGSTISNATTATLTIMNPGTADAATNYNVRVSSTSGCGPIFSNNASLTVNALPAVTNPANASTCAGTAVSFSVTGSGSGTLSYQWYKNGNTTIVSNGPTGTGSTISGATTATLTITNPGTADATTYNVRVTSSTGCTPATSANATLTVNTLPAIGSQPASITSGACTGNPVSFTATANGSGTLSYQWYKGATALNNGATGTGSIIAGATTATLTINNPSPADNATNYNVIVSSSTGCTPAQSGNAALTITPPDEASSTTSGSKVISSTNTVISNASCALIATVAPSGAAGTQVGGNVSATVIITGTVQNSPNGSPYVQRHYDIVPAVNPATATATLTLYFTQAEFTAYNAAPNHGTNLPIDATDAANNKANIRIIQYHGTGTLPGNYTGTSEALNPADNAIIWNATYSRWEVTFSVNGFSGFYLVSADNLILPLKLISFTGHTDGNTAWLQWKTSDEVNVNYFEVERSTDAVHFTKAGQLNAGSSNYNFTDKPDVKTVYYYRLKIVDKDGKISYTHTIAVNLKKAGITVQALPNPFTDKLMLSITSPQQSKAEIRLTDVNGKTLLKKMIMLQTGTNAITLNEVNTLNKGTYFLQVTNEKMKEMIKVVKAE